MKKLFYLLLITVNCLNAQNLDFLDSNNGFKQFKFGYSPNQIENIEKESDWYDEFYTSQNYVPYIYKGSDINTIFGTKIQDIRMSFFNNKLFNIGINLGDYHKNFSLKDYNLIFNRLKEVFGEEFVAAKKEPHIIKGHIWVGKNVTLELILNDWDYDVNNETKRPTLCYILFYHNKLNLAMKKSQF